MTIKHSTISRITRIAILALSLGAVPALAQTDTDANAGSGTTVSTQETNRDNGFDLGWLGLAGLAGLAGLRRKPPEVVRPTATDASRVPQR